MNTEKYRVKRWSLRKRIFFGHLAGRTDNIYTDWIDERCQMFDKAGHIIVNIDFHHEDEWVNSVRQTYVKLVIDYEKNPNAEEV